MQIGTAWLGWTEAETLATLMTTIELAYEGLLEKIAYSTGTTPPMTALPSEPAAPRGPVSGKAIFAVVRSAGKPK